MIRVRHISLCLACLWPLSASAIDIALPEGAIVNGTRSAEMAEFALPVAPWANGSIQTKPLEGAVTKTAWRIPTTGANTGLLMALLRDQLETEGFRTLLDCADERCGGFDFRYSADILPEPQMHVDLGDFRFLSAMRGAGADAEHVQLVVSRSPLNAYVEVSLITETGAEPLIAATKTPMAHSAGAGVTGDLVTSLLENGHVALTGLEFESGSSALSGQEFTVLAQIARFMSDNPDITIALVGHTDATGSLDANMALSRARATSVLERLAQSYGIARDRMEADGVGYLAPIASNRTEEGRTANRRVEVVVTSTE